MDVIIKGKRIQTDKNNCLNNVSEWINETLSQGTLNVRRAIKALDELGDKAIGLAEQFKFESDIESELNEHLDAIQKLLENAEPLKCLEL